MRSFISTGIAAIACSAALVVGAQGAANAAPLPTPGTQSGVTQQDVTNVKNDLTTHGVTPTVSTTSNGTVTTFQIPNSPRIVTTEPPARTGGIQPQVRVGFGSGVYFYFTTIEQQALAAGSAAAVVGAICLISAGTACTLAGVAAAFAGPYIAKYGQCSDGRELEVKVSYFTGQADAKCVG